MAFWDALCLRYEWYPPHLPAESLCGKSFTVEHALSCNRSGFPILRHNEIRDLSAQLMDEVCTNVTIEPELQPLTGESMDLWSANIEDEACLDIRAYWLWGFSCHCSYFDVRVFSPFALSNNQKLSHGYQKHEKEKRRQHDQRVREVNFGRLICPICLFSHWRNGEGCWNYLQEAGFSYTCSYK